MALTGILSGFNEQRDSIANYLSKLEAMRRAQEQLDLEKQKQLSQDKQWNQEMDFRQQQAADAADAQQAQMQEAAFQGMEQSLSKSMQDQRDRMSKAPQEMNQLAQMQRQAKARDALKGLISGDEDVSTMDLSKAILPYDIASGTSLLKAAKEEQRQQTLDKQQAANFERMRSLVNGQQDNSIPQNGQTDTNGKIQSGGVFGEYLSHPDPAIGNMARQGIRLANLGGFKDVSDLNGYLQKIGELDASYQKDRIKKTDKTAQDLPKLEDQANYTLTLLDQLKAHPGLSTSIGAKGLTGGMLGGWVVPGTDAADFNALLDQIQGGQFMQAYETLKGGGQITEVEGKKATAAISRMNKSQSEKGFLQAADEFKSIVQNGLDRAKKSAGAFPTQSPSGNTNTFSAPPDPRQYDGRTITDPSTGIKLLSKNGQWTRVK